MKEIGVFVRDASPEELEFTKKILSSLELDETKYEIINLDLIELKSDNMFSYGIAFGRVCGRLVKDHVKDLLVLSPLPKLRPSPNNSKHRKEAWEKLTAFKERIERGVETNIDGDWQYAILSLGEKRVCIFEKNKPTDIEADVFISRADSNLLLAMKEAFRAEAVVIGEKEDE
ncbi:MAG: hypothetical protein DRN26_00405 [Thermoplasmata archaeon]|nr:MAG: hypothetical protein DRN26_00405 [Thermoplasmata archaeon]